MANPKSNCRATGRELPENHTRDPGPAPDEAGRRVSEHTQAGLIMGLSNRPRPPSIWRHSRPHTSLSTEYPHKLQSGCLGWVARAVRVAVSIHEHQCCMATPRSEFCQSIQGPHMICLTQRSPPRDHQRAPRQATQASHRLISRLLRASRPCVVTVVHDRG